MKPKLLLLFTFLCTLAFSQERPALKQINAAHKTESKALQLQDTQKLNATDATADKIQIKKADFSHTAERSFENETGRAAFTHAKTLKAEKNIEKPSSQIAEEADMDSSPFESVEGKPELTSKRNMFSKTYDNGDGSYTAVVGAGPIHYEKNGQFLDIDHSITVNFDQTYPYVNASNLFQSYFGATSHTGLKNKTDDGELREFLNTKMYWEVNGQPYGVITAADVPVQIEDNKAYYRNIYGSIDAEFTVLTGKRELNYIIPNKQALGNVPAGADYLVFSEEVELPLGWTHQVTHEGIVIKNALGQGIYLYSNPISTDAASELEIVKNTFYETRLTGTTLTVLTKVKTEWLLNDERVYPIKVDPTVYTTNANWFTGRQTTRQRIISTTITNQENNRLSVGRTTDQGWLNDPCYWDSYITFNLSSLPTNVYIGSADLTLRTSDVTSGNKGSFRLTNSSYSRPVSTPYPNIIATGTDDISGTWDLSGYNNNSNYSFDLNHVGVAYLTSNLGGAAALNLYGRHNGSENEYVSFAGHTSSNRPYLRINYSNQCADPVVENNHQSDVYFTRVSFVGSLIEDQTRTSTYSSSPRGYQNWASSSDPIMAKQIPGGVINVDYDTNSHHAFTKAWVDWNQNGVFEANEKVYDSYDVLTPSGVFGFIVPSGTSIGEYKLRIRNSYDTQYFLPCGYTYDGEAEDYKFEVIADCPAKITDININPEDGYRCGTGPVTLSAQGTGTHIRWYYSEYGGAHFSQNAGTYTTPDIGETTTYWVTAWNGSCESVKRVPVTATITPTPSLSLSASEVEFCGEQSAGIEITSSGAVEEYTLLTEKFDSGLGVFHNVRSGYNDPDAFWQRRNSPYVPTRPPYATVSPAIASGYDGGGFACAITDVIQTSNIINRLTLTNTLDASELLNLKVDFDLYYHPTVQGNSAYNYLRLEAWNGSSWQTIQTYNTTQGNPGHWKKITLPIPNNFLINNFRIRFSIFSFGEYDPPYILWTGDIATIDNVRIYGDKPLDANLDWSMGSGVIDIYDADCSTPYSGAAPQICIKPSDSQLEDYANWEIKAEANLHNGCVARKTIKITNMTKVWNTTASDDWADTNNRWKPYPISGANLPPTADNCVIVKKTVNVNNGTHGLGKNLKVKEDGQIFIKDEGSLTITDFVKNENLASDFIVEDGGNLIQINGVAANQGEIITRHYVQDMNNLFIDDMDYVYWSSPVANQNLHAFSPGTPTGHQYWAFLEYDESTDYFENTSDTYFKDAKGYAIGAETTGAGIYDGYDKTYEFEGEPNNGPFNFTLSYTNQGYNLVGNPYPSNIDADILFELGNNPNLIHSLIYLWTNNDPEPYQEGPDYNGNNYAVYNASGGTPSTQAAGSGSGWQMSAIPDGTIRSGQGFIVQAKPGSNGRSLSFQNYDPVTDEMLRIHKKAPFFQKGEKDRYWITLTSPSHILNTALIAYMPGATNGFDGDYDAVFFGASDAIYSMLHGQELIIQGRQHPLDLHDVVPLGINSYEDGVYVIGLENPEGIFGDVRVYLIDKDLGISHNLSKEPYKFFAYSGKYHERFEIRYRRAGFGASVDPNIITAATQKEDIIILSTQENIREVQLFDVLGMEVYQNVKVDGRELRIPASRWMNSVLFARIITEDGEVTTTKVLLK